MSLSAALAALALLPPGVQDHGARHMPPPAKPAAATDAEPAIDHSAHQTAPVDHSAHDMPAQDHSMHHQMQPTGTALPAGQEPAPPPPTDHYADRQFPPDEMARSRAQMMRENGGQSLSLIMFNIAEVQARRGDEGYRWDAEGWFGGDIHRLTIKTEGEGGFRNGIDNAEVQALYSRAMGPYFNLQAGVRHDFEPGRPATYATIGFEGLAPYWFEVEGAAFLSDKGDLLARLEGYYDQRITQRIVLQPRAEVNFSAQDVPETRTGAGLSGAELGLRLRYEISRQFAPYVGINYEASTGRTARYARADGEDPTTTNLVAGVRMWF